MATYEFDDIEIDRFIHRCGPYLNIGHTPEQRARVLHSLALEILPAGEHPELSPGEVLAFANRVQQRALANMALGPRPSTSDLASPKSER